jgi:hypothetical protein
MREQLTSEKLDDRISRMVVEYEKAALSTEPKRHVKK